MVKIVLGYFLTLLLVINVIASGLDLPPRLEVTEQDNSSIANDFVDDEGCTVITLGLLEKRTITSPGYPAKYDSNLQLCWKLICELPTIRIGVKVEDVSIEDFFDVLRFDDDVTGQPIANVTSLSRDFQYFSVGNRMSVRFRSDKSISGARGFRLGCSAVYPAGSTSTLERTFAITADVQELVANSSEQNLTSPGFPADYPGDLDLHWRISTPESGKIIRITFLHFRTDDQELPVDSVDVHDGADVSSPLIAHMYYDNTKLLTFFSSGPSVLVRFRTNRRKWPFRYDTGFSLVYQTVDDSRACSIGQGIALTPVAPSAKFNLPPSYSDELLDCVWRVKALAPNPNKITVHFNRPYDDDDDIRYRDGVQHDEVEEGEKLYVTYGGDDVTVHLGTEESWSRDFSSPTLTLTYKQSRGRTTRPVMIGCELGWTEAGSSSVNSSPSVATVLTLTLFAVLFSSR